jgi:septal ring factor EnvC (AmiA/AmiB activator)
MSGTNGTTTASVVAVLKRADGRWAKDNAGEPAEDTYLEFLATYLQPVVHPAAAAPAVDDRERNRLREQAAAAERSAAKRKAELDQAQAEIAELRQQTEITQQEVVRATAALESVRRERDQLTEQLAATSAQSGSGDDEDVRGQATLIRKLREDYDALAAENQNLADQLAAALAQRNSIADHRCTWQWHGPDEPIKPCTCGRTAPRYELREVSR